MVPMIFVHVKWCLLTWVGIAACPTAAIRPPLVGDDALLRIRDVKNKFSSQTFLE